MKLEVVDPIPPGTHESVGWDKGYRVTKFSLLEEGEEIAYLKVAMITEESWEEACPTVWHWKVHEGWIALKGPLESGNRRDLLRAVYRYQWRSRVKTVDSMSDGEVEDALEALGEDLRGSYGKFAETYVNQPYIDYAYVQKDYRRRGLATSFYQYAAHYFAEKGLRVRCSSLQSEPAKNLWAFFDSQGWTVSYRLPNHPDKDYRTLVATKFRRPVW